MEVAGTFIARHPWIVGVPLALLTVIAIGAGILTIVTVRDVESRVRVIETSPCREIQSKECADYRRDLARNDPLSVPCISFRRIIVPDSVFREYTRCGDFRRKHG